MSILMYADDIALVSDSERNMQGILDIVKNWCHKWRMNINVYKTDIVHFQTKTIRIASADRVRYFGLSFRQYYQ